MNDRLTKCDWLVHGLRTLATEGASALRVVPLAAKLKVSRGSFYWHFRDISDFRSQLLQRWLEETTEQVIRRIETEELEPDRLRSLLIGAFVTAPSLNPEVSPWATEDAIRSWGSEDEDVAAMVASVDDRRLRYMAQLLVAAGVESQKALDRAKFLYFAYLGRTRVMDVEHALLVESSIDDIVQLIESRT